jgi:hypothetical protein
MLNPRARIPTRCSSKSSPLSALNRPTRSCGRLSDWGRSPKCPGRAAGTPFSDLSAASLGGTLSTTTRPLLARGCSQTRSECPKFRREDSSSPKCPYKACEDSGKLVSADQSVMPLGGFPHNYLNLKRNRVASILQLDEDLSIVFTFVACTTSSKLRITSIALPMHTPTISLPGYS